MNGVLVLEMSNSEIATAIRSIGLVLHKMLDRVQNTEKEVLKMKSSLLNNKPKEKQTVPLVVRVRCLIQLF